ncbi:efflux RND transporter periplasmic adaptor subunit [Henriciella aquimarina]|uniref:efflux RND transporter periplasmic adaptor subunit n=1 Tax=Henriciella aquimarina TaxID=545261 RepID=UPI000A06D3DF|nr:efflux RND transporter periplasmic adaptor subunit [Henriciella aquimarina]
MDNCVKALSAIFVLSLAVACGDGEPATEAPPSPEPVASVQTAQVARRDVVTWIFSEGTARAIEREFLSFESAGRIAYVDQTLKEGDLVEAGQLIAYQEKNRPDEDGTIMHAAVREARADLELAQRTFSRFSALLEQRSASQQEYDEAKAKLEQAQVKYRNALITASESRIVSPINGILARLNIEQGYYFTPQQVQSSSEAGALHTVPVVIINPSAFEVTISLPSYRDQEIAVGGRVLFERNIGQEITGRANVRDTDMPSHEAGDGDVLGTVYAISPSVDPETRTFRAKLRTDEGPQTLQDGEFITAWIEGPSAQDALTVPIEAIRYTDNTPFVFLLSGQTNTVEKTPIRMGLRGRHYIQVLDGVSDGDTVVTKGRSRLSSGDLVRVIEQTAAENTSAAP